MTSQHPGPSSPGPAASGATFPPSEQHSQQYPQQPALPQQTRRGIGTAGLVTAVVGGIVLFGLGATAAFTMAFASQPATGVAASASLGAPIDASGVTSLNLNAGVAELDVAFADVSGATLKTSGANADRWEFSRSGDTLQVRAPKTNSGWCVFGLCPSSRGQHMGATLTLPSELVESALDADIRVGVGSVRAAGVFGALKVKVDVGEAVISGAAKQLDLDIGVGTFTGGFADTESVQARVALGDLELALTGEPPADVNLEVSTGAIELVVPPAEYDVAISRSLGDVENALQTAAGAPHKISAKAELGDISLREGR
ncbi:hypothetical protein ACFSWE_14285 [Leucobacter albus]|uniref:Adhesin n=1 Tax=Leucobacter albus TaxID=272210 RepID=A0ABW3TKJ5_9MICO